MALPPELALYCLRLERGALDRLPAPTWPPGFTVHGFRAGDESRWVAVVGEADSLLPISGETFARAFPGEPAELAQRVMFLQAPGGETVGTVAAWRGDARGGRVHWLAVRPAWQRRGLGSGLLLLALSRLRALGHDRAWLITEAGRPQALRLYRRWGFEPELRTSEDRQVWEVLQRAGWL